MDNTFVSVRGCVGLSERLMAGERHPEVEPTESWDGDHESDRLLQSARMRMGNHFPNNNKDFANSGRQYQFSVIGGSLDLRSDGADPQGPYS